MKVTKRGVNQSTRNNTSSLDCDHYSFTYFSWNNNSDTIWRKWDNKNGTKS